IASICRAQRSRDWLPASSATRRSISRNSSGVTEPAVCPALVAGFAFLLDMPIPPFTCEISLGPPAHGVDHPGAARGAVLEGDGADVLAVLAAVVDQLLPLLGIVGLLTAVDVVLVGLDDGRAAVLDEAPDHQVADHAVRQHEAGHGRLAV